MGIDLFRHPAELAPLLPELRRFVGRLQQIAAFPLDVIDDAPSVEAPLEDDRAEPRLLGPQVGPLGHQGQRIGLQLGRGSCRVRECRSVYISVIAVPIIKKTNTYKSTHST